MQTKIWVILTAIASLSQAFHQNGLYARDAYDAGFAAGLQARDLDGVMDDEYAEFAVRDVFWDEDDILASLIARSGRGGGGKKDPIPIYEDNTRTGGGGNAQDRSGALRPVRPDVQRENDNGANIRNNHPAQDGSGGGRENRAPQSGRGGGGGRGRRG